MARCFLTRTRARSGSSSCCGATCTTQPQPLRHSAPGLAALRASTQSPRTSLSKICPDEQTCRRRHRSRSSQWTRTVERHFGGQRRLGRPAICTMPRCDANGEGGVMCAYVCVRAHGCVLCTCAVPKQSQTASPRKQRCRMQTHACFHTHIDFMHENFCRSCLPACPKS